MGVCANPALPDLLYAGCYTGTHYVGSHSHSGTELVLVNRGACTVRVGRTVLEGAAGSLFVLPAGALHDQRARGRTQTHFVSFAGPAQSLNAAEPQTVNLEQPSFQLVLACMRQLVCLFERLPDTGPGPAQGLLYALASAVEPRLSGCVRVEMPPPLVRILRLIERSPGTRLDVATLATHACTSASHLTALFRRHLRSSPLQYVLSARMRLAQRLMANPYLSVKEVCYQCGFDDPAYFSRRFRLATGQSPRQFRERRMHRAR